jgi:hypothetical protein
LGRSFTQLTYKDFPLLYNGKKGSIKFNEALFNVDPPHYFHTQLRDLTITATRDKEAGARLLIGHYLCHAVLQARQIFGLDRLVFNSEVDVEPEQIPDVGWLTGILDFATCLVGGTGKVGNITFTLTN